MPFGDIPSFLGFFMHINTHFYLGCQNFLSPLSAGRNCDDSVWNDFHRKKKKKVWVKSWRRLERGLYMLQSQLEVSNRHKIAQQCFLYNCCSQVSLGK